MPMWMKDVYIKRNWGKMNKLYLYYTTRREETFAYIDNMQNFMGAINIQKWLDGKNNENVF